MAKIYIEYRNEDLEHVEAAINSKGLFLSFDMDGDNVVVDDGDKALFGALVIDLLVAGAKILSFNAMAR